MTGCLCCLICITQVELSTSSVNEDPSAWYTESLASVMRGVEHLDKRGPTAIVNEYGDYPYAHFTVPVCGLPMSKVDIRGRSSRRPQSKQAAETSFFEEVEQVVGPSFSADSMDSRSVEPPSTQPQQSEGTVVSLPPLKSDSDTTAQNGSGPVDSGFADFQSSNDAM